jgi:oligoribonuclease
VAVIITDFDFNELATYEAVIYQTDTVLKNSNEFSLFAHEKSGLYDSVRKSNVDERAAEEAVVALIQVYVPEGAVYLAGNSIKSDRSFIDTHWKKMSGILHYRMLDVTSFKLWWLGSGHNEYKKGEAHRALDDIRESIAELKFYLSELKK